jgi:hypothetical protein
VVMLLGTIIAHLPCPLLTQDIQNPWMHGTSSPRMNLSVNFAANTQVLRGCCPIVTSTSASFRTGMQHHLQNVQQGRFSLRWSCSDVVSGNCHGCPNVSGHKARRVPSGHQLLDYHHSSLSLHQVCDARGSTFLESAPTCFLGPS